jgi:polyferredoxin
MHELLRPFAHLHVLGVALIGCLVVALLTGEQWWGWVGLLGALVAASREAILLYRALRHRTS